MAADWISPTDRLPPEGQPVQISILRNSPDVSVGRRLGETWWIDRQQGGAIQMHEPKIPAYWRPAAQAKTSEGVA
jgi:hypothetical protein